MRESCNRTKKEWSEPAVRRPRGLILAAVLAAAVFAADAAERWRVHPLSLPRGARLVLYDIKMLSTSQGIATGYLSVGSEIYPTSLITADGGRRWTFAETPEAGRALFFVGQRTGWMVAAGSLWKTGDAGRTWQRLPGSDATRSVSRVYFRDELTGWAVGAGKGVYRTEDGGVSWEPARVVGAADLTPDRTSYDWIAFGSEQVGMIAGASVPPKSNRPGSRELPHLTLFLDTRDGGLTWTASTTSMFGRVTRVAFHPSGKGLGLIEFREEFDYPSEVFSIDWRSGKSARVFRRADVAVTDIGFDSKGRGWLAGVQRRKRNPVGRIKVYRSDDLSSWTEVAVERGPAAGRLTLALCCGEVPWMAADNGVLLRLDGP